MLSRGSLFTVCCLVCCTALPAGAQERQGRQGGRGRGAQTQEPARPPATDKVTPEIPGVVKAGTKIEIGATRSPDDLPQAVYYITPNKKVIRVADDINRPNGITLSPDEKTLYVNDWDGPYLVAYSVQSDGTLKNRRNFAKFDLKQETDHGLVSGADGLCIDGAGHTFSTTPAGVQVFNAKGEHLGNIEAPYDMPPQNCGFGGPGGRYLYVTGRGVVYRIQTLNAGVKDRGK